MFGSGIEVYQGTFLWLQKQQKTPKAKNYPTFEVLGYPFYDKISTTRVPQRLLPALAGYAHFKAQANRNTESNGLNFSSTFYGVELLRNLVRA